MFFCSFYFNGSLRLITDSGTVKIYNIGILYRKKKN